MKFIFALLLISSAANATRNDLAHRPRSFTTDTGRAVFVDFTQAIYNITYDIPNKSARVVAEIKFDAPEAGLPIFDSVQDPTSIVLDGVQVTSKLTQTPSKETTLRLINAPVAVGSHTMTISVPLNELLSFSTDGVKSAFWTSDLDSRKFLERYLPANFEFDQVQMAFNITFIGGRAKQTIYTNGVMKEIKSNMIQIVYPSYYTSSSIFFHTVPEGAVQELRFTLKSIDGRTLPAVVYVGKSGWPSGNLDGWKKKIESIFHELESDYGAFLHPSVTVYNAGAGGMEYCGATITDSMALGHELFHSYFARGVMPANGNSGWLDEALASWRDNGYPAREEMNGSSKMSAHPYYTRTTDRAAYSFGAKFMSYLDGKFKDKGGLKQFLRHMVDKRSFSPLFVEEFIKEMGEFYGKSAEADFKKYTYGTEDFSNLKDSNSHIHRKMTLEELKKYL